MSDQSVVGVPEFKAIGNPEHKRAVARKAVYDAVSNALALLEESHLDRSLDYTALDGAAEGMAEAYGDTKSDFFPVRAKPTPDEKREAAMAREP